MSRFIKHVMVVLFMFVITNSVSAFDVLFTLESTNPTSGGWFGYNCEGIGDVDNDGYDDIGIAATFEDPDGKINAGRAYVFSGATGDTLYVLTSPNMEASGEYGWFTELGDVNDDGHDDFVVTAWQETAVDLYNAGMVYVYSGATGDTLYSVDSPTPEIGGKFGTEAGCAGDVNDDGYQDFAVTSWYEDSLYADVGKVHIFSGMSGEHLRTYVSPNQSYDALFGKPLANAGDVNNDGWDDLLIGARKEDAGGTNAGMAYVFSGATGHVLLSLYPPDPQSLSNFGRAVSGAGDVNGDGYADLVVGAPKLDAPYQDCGRAYVFDGATGSVIGPLNSLQPAVNGYFGWSTWGGEDYDHDGFSDVVVGACGENGPYSGSGRAYVFSGQTLDLIEELVSSNPEINGDFGSWVGEGPDVNGDGLRDLVISAREENGGAIDAGRTYVFSRILLSGNESGGSFVLNWSPWPTVLEYWVYGADNTTYFLPGLTFPYPNRLAEVSSETTSWSTTAGVDDPDHNWTYLVIATGVVGQELTQSNRVGEYDYTMTIGP